MADIDTPPAYTDPYAQAIAAQRALIAVPTQAKLDQDTIARRRQAMNDQETLGMLAMLSGNEGLQGLGSMIYKGAQARSAPRVSDQGTYDPTTQQFAYFPEVERTRQQTQLERLEDKSAALQAARAQQAQQQEFLRSEQELTRAAAAARGEPLMPVMVNGQPMFVPRSQAVGMQPAPMGGPGQPSEGERKAASLLARLQFSQAQYAQAIADDPKAVVPSLGNKAVQGIPFAGEDAANYTRSPARQRVEDAQLDMLDAALTLGTGAAYTREQLKGYTRSYFPQPGDGPQNIADKQARLANVIHSAEIAAGRAAPPPAPSMDALPPLPPLGASLPRAVAARAAARAASAPGSPSAAPGSLADPFNVRPLLGGQ